MKSIHVEADRRAIVARMRTLGTASKAQWGKFTAPRMVAHLADSVRMASGVLTPASKKSPLRFTPLKQFVIYAAPFPRNVPTAPELIARAPSSWNVEVADFADLIEGLARRDVDGAWPTHPIFGTLSGAQWGVLVYRHCDHHLRQFGA
jgi:hypothetical protein